MIIHTEKILVAMDLMTPNPRSLRTGETVKEAMAFLISNSFSAAPVINDAGRPVGVLSVTDIVRSQSESVTYLQREKYESASRKLVTGERIGEGYEIEKVPTVTVDEIMSPVLYSVQANASVSSLIEEMLERSVHRMFVLDAEGTLVGVITTMDILRALKSATF